MQCSKVDLDCGRAAFTSLLLQTSSEIKLTENKPLGPVITMFDCNFSNNGSDGIRNENPHTVFNMTRVSATGNGGQGFNNILNLGNFIESLGLPKETDPTELANILRSLQDIDPPKRAAIVSGSVILSKLGNTTLNASTIIANILTIAASPTVTATIKRLLSWS